MRRTGLAAVLLALGLAALPAAAGAQQRTPQDLSQSQRRLQEIRQERRQLSEELKNLRSQVRDLSGEARILRRQVTVSSGVIRELEFQLARTEQQIASTTRELLQTQDRLAERRALLHRRLRDIYKRGPLLAVEVLLTAESFSELLNRYKYLYLVARHDRALMEEVKELEQELVVRDRQLKRSLNEVQTLRGERVNEHTRLQELEREQVRTLGMVRRQEQNTVRRVAQLARDERRLTSLITTLERRRREAERREAERARVAARNDPGAPGATSRTPAPTARSSPESRLSTSDLGSLGWPVEGRVLYRFGRTTTPNGTTLRWNGVGIEAAQGTPVRAVEGGTVALAQPFEGYGPSVVLSHGGGYYSLYLYLDDIRVADGAEVSRGQVIGTVGGAGTPEGPHIEFQIRAPGGQAVDPLAWLQRRGQ
ncbi:MAG TPA: peptidoglycan DD-metalloendopeptidase family protein [Longimicrobiaceae bacterium]|nr:peptidoglycan DD-metalloendopeptidase family protein [Longimicrobiaceae bacterium]